MGIGLGLVYMPSIVIMSQHFTNRPMLAMVISTRHILYVMSNSLSQGIVSTGGSAGGLVFPSELEKWIQPLGTS